MTGNQEPATGRAEQVMARLGLTLVTRENVVFPRAAAPVLHGAVHRLLESASPALAHRVHEQVMKPFALSMPRLPDSPAGSLSSAPAGARIAVEIGVLESATLGVLLAALLAAWRSGAPLSLDGRAAAIVDCRMLAGPWSYSALLAQSEPASALTMRFVSPTVFKRRGEGGIDPADATPRMVFGGLLRRWDAFAPSGLLAAVTDAALQTNITETGRDWQIVTVNLGVVQQRAMTGWASFRIEGDPEFRRAIAALATYSTIGGAGARTAYGFGQTVVEQPVIASTPPGDATKGAHPLVFPMSTEQFQQTRRAAAARPLARGARDLPGNRPVSLGTGKERAR